MSVRTLESNAAGSVTPVIEGDARLFQENFNRASFQFAHYLAGNPLFELPRLLELARRQAEGDVYYDAGDIPVDLRWDQTPRTALTVEQLIDRIENAGAWILIRRAQIDPRYDLLLQQALAEVQQLIGARFPKKVKTSNARVFITSPNRISTYHIDRECNYLLQIRGDKVISVFDRYDRDVLPEEEIERFWTVDNNAPTYKKQYQERARTYQLRPGTGIHLPVNAPHWVKNGNNISVTLAVTFEFPDSELANIYRMNYFLRKAGLRPWPPGRSRVRDAVKSWSMGSAIGARKTLRRVFGKT